MSQLTLVERSSQRFKAEAGSAEIDTENLRKNEREYFQDKIKAEMVDLGIKRIKSFERLANVILR